MKTKIPAILLAAAILFSFAACGKTDNTETTTVASTTAAATTAAAKTFTAAQLAGFTGIDGKAAYLAYDGKVYDVSNEKVWDSGSHFGLVVGTDVTAQVKACSKHLIAFMEGQFASYPVAGNYMG